MSNRKILIVEDEPAIRRMLIQSLTEEGFEVYEAEDGGAGFKMAEDVVPDLIITDVLMPNIDGNVFIKALRETDFGKNIPIIVLTARGLMKDYFEMMEIEAFIEKPFSTQELLDKVNGVFEKYKLRTMLKDKKDELERNQQEREKAQKETGGKTVRADENASSKKSLLGKSYKYCGNCKKIADISVNLCPSCGNTDLVTKEK